jgi:hypothetical protein
MLILLHKTWRRRRLSSKPRFLCLNKSFCSISVRRLKVKLHHFFLRRFHKCANCFFRLSLNYTFAQRVVNGLWGPGFLAVVWFGSFPLSQQARPATHRKRLRETCWRERREGAKSYSTVWKTLYNTLNTLWLCSHSWCPSWFRWYSRALFKHWNVTVLIAYNIIFRILGSEESEIIALISCILMFQNLQKDWTKLCIL